MALLLSTFFWLKTEKGRLTACNLISKCIEKNMGYHYEVKIEGLDLSLFFKIKVKKVTLFYKKSRCFIIKDFDTAIVPSLWGSINIKDINVQELIILKIPTLKTSSKKTFIKARKKNFIIPNINLRSVSINKLIIPHYSNGSSINKTFKVTVKLDSENDIIHFVTDFKANSLTYLTDNKNPVLRSDPTLLIQGKLNLVKKRIVIKKFNLCTSYLKVEGKVIIDFLKNFISGDSRCCIYSEADFPYQKKILEEKECLKGTIDFSGPLSYPQITTSGKIHFEDSRNKFFRFPEINWLVDFKVAEKAINGQAFFNAGPIKGSTKISINNAAKLYLEDLTVQGKSLFGKGNLGFNNNNKSVFGKFNIKSNDISELKIFCPSLKGGQVNIKLAYHGINIKKAQLHILGKIKKLTTSFASCDLVDFSLSVNLFKKLILEYINVKIDSLLTYYGRIQFLSLFAKDSINGGTEFAINLNSKFPFYPLDLKIDGEISKNNKNKTLRGHINHAVINSITGTVRKIKIDTGESIKLCWGNHKSIFVPKLIADNGKLSLDLRIKESQIHGKLELAEFPLTIVANLPSNFKQSAVSGKLSVSGTFQKPLINSKIEICNISFGQKNLPSTLSLLAYLKSNKLTLIADIEQEKNKVVTFDFQGYDVNLWPLKDFSLRKSKLSADLRITDKIDILNLLPLPEAHKVHGFLDGKINLSGNIDSLTVSGGMIIKKGEYNYQSYGVNIKNISGRIVSKNNTVLMINLTAHDDYSNLLSMKGSLILNKNLTFKLNMDTKRFNFFTNPYLQGEIAGNLLVSGNRSKSLAQGNFSVGPIEIRIPEYFPDDFPSINIVEVINNHGMITSYNTKNKKEHILNVDVNLDVAQQVYVKGRGVDALLAGNLKVSGDINSPSIFGELKSLRGRYQEFGKVLTVKEGVVTFNGTLPKSPYLNIVGSTILGNTEIRLILAGSILSPNIRIESSPSMTQQDALSLLLFGKNTDSISATQAIGLANSMQKLSGSSSTFDPISLGKEILGVDDISIKEDATTASSYLKIGKHLTNKIYLEIEQGNQDFGTKSKLEIQLSPELFFEVTSGIKGNNTLGINWSINY